MVYRYRVVSNCGDCGPPAQENGKARDAEEGEVEGLGRQKESVETGGR
jgi:hypothetical protein